jgi:hypothetical protein
VIEKYVDPGHKFAGLGAFVCYALRKDPTAECPGTGGST